MESDNDNGKNTINNENNTERYISESELNKNYVKKKSLLKRIINFVLWIIVLGWAAMIIIDYVNFNNNKKLNFCIINGIIDYTDGSVEWCKGPGYIVYKYDRTCYKGAEFGPIWNKDRSLTEESCKE